MLAALLVGCSTVMLANAIDVTTAWARVLHAAMGCALLFGGLAAYVLLWATQRRGWETPLPRGAFSVLLVVLAMFQFLGSVEAFARAFPIDDSMAANPGSRFLWPEFYLQPNSLGYKDREPGPKEGPRILVLGDSYAEGAGVRRDERFSSRLERLYREGGDPGVEVLNAGRCGMDTADQSRVLRETGDAIEPDAVVVAYVPNDADGRGIRPVRSGGVGWLGQRLLGVVPSYALYRLRCLTNPYCGGLPALGKDPLILQHRRTTEGWRLVEESLAEIAEWCRQRSIPAYFVALPLFTAGGDRYRNILEQATSEAGGHGFDARNGTDDFGVDLGDLGVSHHDGHPGAAAHAIIAGELYRQIGRPWSEGSLRPRPVQSR